MTQSPFYARVQRDIVQRVQRGEYPVDSRIPTEQDLCALYGVSRITVRRALENLVSSNVLYRRRGVGTFVRGQVGPGKSVRFFGHLTDMLTFDHAHRYQLLARGPHLPPKSVAECFGVTGPLYRIQTANFLEDLPYAVADFYFADEYRAAVDRMDLQAGQLPIQYLEETVGVRVKRGEQTIVPDAARGNVAATLGLKTGTPILRMQRVYLGIDDKPLEVVISRYHPDRYHFTIDLLVPGIER
jgi:DNA-binding GntR family transcriptional regulator